MPQREPGRGSERGEQRAFGGEHAADLAARQPEVAQHAELAPAREHHGAEARRQAEEADQHRDRFHGIGDGEAAVEDAQRDVADLARVGDLERLAAGKRAQRAHQLGRARAGREPCGAIVHPVVAGEPHVFRAVDEEGAVLARVVAENADDTQTIAAAAQRQLDHVARLVAVNVGDRLAHPDAGRWNGFQAAHRRESKRGVIARHQHERRTRRIENHAAARRKSRRATCGSARTRSTNAGSSTPVSPACVVRKYSPQAAPCRASRPPTGGTTRP